MKANNNKLSPPFIFTNSFELFAESIPCTVIQVYALLGEQEFDFWLYASLCVSVTVAANMTVNIDEKKDADIDNRHNHPNFFGFIPSGKKKYIVKFCMFTMSCCQLLMKSLTMCLIFKLFGGEWDRAHHTKQNTTQLKPFAQVSIARCCFWANCWFFLATNACAGT